MAASLYNLAWAGFGNSLVSAVQLLRHHDQLVDCTLSAEGKSFQAHKIVLSAASPFLLDLFKNTTCKHPVILLAGVQATDMEALLEFIYKGEVSVDQSQLPSLLQAAQCLNIQGLTQCSQDGHQLNMKSASEHEQKTPSNPSHVDAGNHSQKEETMDKKKKYLKRPHKSLSPSLANKIPRVHYNTESSTTIPQENSAQSWPPYMNFGSLGTSNAENLSPLIMPSLPPCIPSSVPSTTANSSSTGPKIRGASDQPGTCPLCGAMLRQARNLRRHLLSSCKYRMVNGIGSSHHTLSASFVDDTTKEFHNLQPLVVHNTERDSHPHAHLLSKRTSTPCELSTAPDINSVRHSDL